MKWIISISLLMSLPGLVLALTAKEIVDQVDENQRIINDSTLTISSLSSCKFGKQGKQIVCVSEPRVKKLESVSKQLGQDNKDSQNISIVLEPASEKGIGQLTYSFDDIKRDTESWLYLSALGRVKRLAGGTGEDAEPVSLFGSEYTTEDMESGKTDEYTYTILQEGEYKKRKVWVIESKPKPERLKRTEYSRSIIWIDQERFVPMKVQNYDKRGNLYKRMLFKRFEEINNIWMARESTIFNFKQQRLSSMVTQEIAMNVDVHADFLTQRTLTDFAFRERELGQLRQFFE